MKRNGKPLSHIACSRAVIPREEGENLVFKIRAIPLGFSEQLSEDFPTPRPPVISTGSKGSVRKERDLEDPGYLSALNRCQIRKNALIIHYALGADSSIEFSASESLGRAEFADSVFKELVESGFSGGDIAILLDQIDHISNSTMDQVRKARSLFLSPEAEEGEQESAGNSQGNTA